MEPQGAEEEQQMGTDRRNYAIANRNGVKQAGSCRGLSQRNEMKIMTGQIRCQGLARPRLVSAVSTAHQQQRKCCIMKKRLRKYIMNLIIWIKKANHEHLCGLFSDARRSMTGCQNLM